VDDIVETKDSGFALIGTIRTDYTNIFVKFGITKKYSWLADRGHRRDSKRSKWIAKVDKYGNIMSAEYLVKNTQSIDSCCNIINTNDGGFLLIGKIDDEKLEENYVIRKYDKSGINKWQKHVSEYNSIDTSGNVCFSTLNSKKDHYPTNSELMVECIDDDGKSTFKKTIKSYNQFAHLILFEVVENIGFIIITHANDKYNVMIIDEVGNVLKEKDIDSDSIRVDSIKHNKTGAFVLNNSKNNVMNIFMLTKDDYLNILELPYTYANVYHTKDNKYLVAKEHLSYYSSNENIINIAKIENNGEILWTKEQKGLMFNLKLPSDGGCLLETINNNAEIKRHLLFFNKKIDLGIEHIITQFDAHGYTQWEIKSNDEYGIYPTSNNEALIAKKGEDNNQLIKIGSNGKQVWKLDITQYYTSDRTNISHVTQLFNGDYLLAEISYDNIIGIWLSKISHEGKLKWKKNVINVNGSILDIANNQR
jgi:hypothetical protein